jgi:predicted negative regulator of RcsB-dependent stress response
MQEGSMMAFILKHWRWLGSFLALALLYGWINWQSHQITTLKRDLLVSRASVASYEESLNILQADTKAKIEALEQERDRQITRTQNMERLLGRIEGASDEQNAPVAPVLRDTIDRLYGRTADADQSR